jgi:prostaglandin-E synthase
MSATLTPQVLWAQRKNCIFLTVCVEDCKTPVVKIEENSVSFSGKGLDSKDYAVTIDLFEPITVDQSVHEVRGRGTEFVLAKAKESFWPRLTKSQQKYHWLKVDFNKWKDEDDDSEDESAGMGMPGMGMPGMGGMGGMGGENMDFAEMMKSMGGLGGGDMMSGKPSMADLPDGEGSSDSDDDDLPQLE